MTSCRPFIRNSWVCGPLVALTLAAGPARAQENTGAISGTVVDEAGQLLPGATVTVIEEATGQSRTAATDARGAFSSRRCGPAATRSGSSSRTSGTLERKRMVLTAADRLSLGDVAAHGRPGRERRGRGGGLGDQHRGQPAHRPHHGEPDRADPGQGPRRHVADAAGARRALRGHRGVARRELRHARPARERPAPRLEHDHDRRRARQRGRPDQPHGAADQPRRGRARSRCCSTATARSTAAAPARRSRSSARAATPTTTATPTGTGATSTGTPTTSSTTRANRPARPLPLQHLGREPRRADPGLEQGAARRSSSSSTRSRRRSPSGPARCAATACRPRRSAPATSRRPAT